MEAPRVSKNEIFCAPIHHDDRTVLIISMKVLDDADEGLRIVIVRPQTALIRRRLNDPGAELVIILQRPNRDFQQNCPVHSLLRSAESYSERLGFEILSFDGPKLRIFLSSSILRYKVSFLLLLHTIMLFETYLVALSQHDDSLRIVVPHHLPELHYGALHRMLRYDKFAVALKA